MILVQVVFGMYHKIKCVCIISASHCMSQKTEKPVLSGQRIKARKRGELITFLLCVCVTVAYHVCGVLDSASAASAV
jgi:hypothetical protein